MFVFGRSEGYDDWRQLNVSNDRTSCMCSQRIASALQTLNIVRLTAENELCRSGQNGKFFASVNTHCLGGIQDESIRRRRDESAAAGDLSLREDDIEDSNAEPSR